MKIAYLVLCHTDPDHVARLAKKLTVGTKNAVFLHVDKKADVAPFQTLLRGIERVYFVEDRVKVYWGGFSSVQATINGFRQAVQKGGFDRYVLLQGLEYPIKSNKEIEKFFEDHKTTEYIRAQNISKSDRMEDQRKTRLFWNMDKRKNPFWWGINNLNFVFLKWKVLPKTRRNTVKLNGKRRDIYQGCAQIALTDEAVKYIIKTYDENKAFNRYFSHVFASDESYFHTVIYNSGYVSHTPDMGALQNKELVELENLTYFEYGKSVALFTEREIYDRLKGTDFLFVRKVSSESRQLVDYIDELTRD